MRGPESPGWTGRPLTPAWMPPIGSFLLRCWQLCTPTGPFLACLLPRHDRLRGLWVDPSARSFLLMAACAGREHCMASLEHQV